MAVRCAIATPTIYYLPTIQSHTVTHYNIYNVHWKLYNIRETCAGLGLVNRTRPLYADTYMYVRMHFDPTPRL